MTLKIFILFYKVLWIFLLPPILLYLRMRGRKDDLYWKHLGTTVVTCPNLLYGFMQSVLGSFVLARHLSI